MIPSALHMGSCSINKYLVPDYFFHSWWPVVIRLMLTFTFSGWRCQCMKESFRWIETLFPFSFFLCSCTCISSVVVFKTLPDATTDASASARTQFIHSIHRIIDLESSSAGGVLFYERKRSSQLLWNSYYPLSGRKAVWNYLSQMLW